MSADDQLPGLAVPEQPAAALQTAVAAAVKAASLDDRDAGMAALAVSCARAVDLAHGRRDPYAVATAARELRETLIRLRLDPASRMGADAGSVEGFLASLATPEQVEG